jgi:hypothetical protein
MQMRRTRLVRQNISFSQLNHPKKERVVEIFSCLFLDFSSQIFVMGKASENRRYRYKSLVLPSLAAFARERGPLDVDREKNIIRIDRGTNNHHDIAAESFSWLFVSSLFGRFRVIMECYSRLDVQNWWGVSSDIFHGAGEPVGRAENDRLLSGDQ